MYKLMIAIVSVLILASNSTVAEPGHKAGDARIEPFMDTYGYIPREEAGSTLERGEQVFVQWCAICHRDGTGMAGTLVLKMRYKGAVPALLEERTDLTGPLLEVFVRQGMGSMPYFRKTEISDSDFEALTTYLTRNNN